MLLSSPIGLITKHKTTPIFQQLADLAGSTQSPHHVEVAWLLVLLGVLVTAAIVIRIYMVRVSKRRLSISDWLIAASLLPILLFLILTGLATQKYGFNHHLLDLSTAEMVLAVQISFYADLSYSYICTMVKLSILFLYLQMVDRSQGKTFKRLIWLNIGFVISACAGYTIGLLTTCWPVQAFWLQVDTAWTEDHDYRCTPELGPMLAASVTIAAMDFAVALLPIHFFLSLQMVWYRKLALMSLFGVGCCAGFTAVVRIYYTYVAYNDLADWTWHTWYMWVWTAAELAIGAVCACAPALKAFYLHCTTKVGRSKDTNSSSTITCVATSEDAGTSPMSSTEREMKRVSSLTPLILGTFRRASSFAVSPWRRCSSLTVTPMTEEAMEQEKSNIDLEGQRKTGMTIHINPFATPSPSPYNLGGNNNDNSNNDNNNNNVSNNNRPTTISRLLSFRPITRRQQTSYFTSSSTSPATPQSQPQQHQTQSLSPLQRNTTTSPAIRPHIRRHETWWDSWETSMNALDRRVTTSSVAVAVPISSPSSVSLSSLTKGSQKAQHVHHQKKSNSFAPLHHTLSKQPVCTSTPHSESLRHHPSSLPHSHPGLDRDDDEDTRDNNKRPCVHGREPSWYSCEMNPECKAVWAGLRDEEKELCVKVRSTLEVVLEPIEKGEVIERGGRGGGGGMFA